MNKAELIEAIAKKVSGVSKRAVGDMLDAFTGTVAASLKKRESVTLVGFGTFKTGKRAARTGRNPQTREPIKIKAKTVVKFSAGASLKTFINK